jgi:predicted NAD/FAD-dependent oxidoreductase
VQLQSKVTGLTVVQARIRLTLEDGRELAAPKVVLALAPEQAGAQLEALAHLPQVASARAVLGLASSQACLVVRTLYPADTPLPEWQVRYPESSTILQMISLDSTKRSHPRRPALVYQAHPTWSRAHLEDPGWPGLMLAEAERLLGSWAARPEVMEPHRWRLARSDRSAELAQPMLLELPGGAVLGLCGDRFAPGGGVEAAWLSGRHLAQRILALEAR